MHDAAISTWGIKGYYDYLRPVSAIRFMAEMGQSSDTLLPNYHKMGLPLIEGFSELVTFASNLVLELGIITSLQPFSPGILEAVIVNCSDESNLRDS